MIGNDAGERKKLSHHEQMLDAQAGCVPCKLCGGSAVITDAGTGAGYYVACGNSVSFHAYEGCLINQRRLGGWAYNVMDWWNRLHAPASAGVLVEALRRLEQANQAVAAATTRERYLTDLADVQPALLELDDARAAARQALSTTATPASDGETAGDGNMMGVWAEAVRETNRLCYELDITNADHIVLWLEHQLNGHVGPLAYIACRILDAHEAAMTATPDRFGEEIGAVTAEMRRFMPNSCGDWADKIDALVGGVSKPEPLTAAEHGELCGYIHGKDYRDNTVEAVAYRQSRFEDLKHRHDAHAAVKAAPDRFGEGYRAGVEAAVGKVNAEYNLHKQHHDANKAAGKKKEARDFETMMIAHSQSRAAIRALQPDAGEGA